MTVDDVNVSSDLTMESNTIHAAPIAILPAHITTEFVKWLADTDRELWWVGGKSGFYWSGLLRWSS